MDESLSEFQEKKEISVPKSTKSKAKTTQKRQRTKKIRGQKDIRSTLSSKSDLISFTEDFNKVCLQSGVDVDAEQLQIAIALSKSIESSCDSVSNDSESLKTQNSEDTVRKIRKTLLEYGFKVPDLKIDSGIGKRKKRKKSYKLLVTSDSEKQQIIAEKYSQVLFNVPNKVNSPPNDCFIKNASVGVYFKATSIPYSLMKDNNIYYITNLIEISANTVGSLLKDWSKIPGRPASPIKETVNMNFSEIDCSQDEIDSILSGSLKCVQNIMKTKAPNKIVDLTDFNNPVDKSNELHDLELNSNIEYTKDRLLTNVTDLKVEGFTQRFRSASPDLFDDEVSVILDTKAAIHSQAAHKENTIFMDLTDCCPVTSQKSNKSLSSQSETRSQRSPSNVTRRKSNDIMEITDCVTSSSQPLHENIQNQGCLSVAFGNSNMNRSYQDEQDIISNVKQCAQNISDDNIKISMIEVSTGADTCRSHVLCKANTNSCNTVENRTVVEIDNEDNFDVDLTQSSSTSDELPCVFLSGANNKSLDNIIILDENEYIKDRIAVQEHVNSYLQKEGKSTSPATIDNNFEEFIYHHSDHSSIDNMKEIYDLNEETQQVNENVLNLTQSSDSNEKVDLQINETPKLSYDSKTQSTEINERLDLLMNETPKSSYDSNSLGKENNVSIDYDEFLNKGTENNSMINPADQLEEDNEVNSSQRSAVFEISDNEFNYSVQQSIYIDNFNLGGISVIDNLSNVNSTKKSSSDNSSEDNLENISILPGVELRENIQHKATPELDKSKSSFKIPNISVETPTNSAYIIKTTKVTPMLDYTSMTTPERNRELNKYGLKPLKRKRAIQLLTHIYNQTHPIVESCEDRVSKKMKKDIPRTSPIHNIYSPKKQGDCEKQDKISKMKELDVPNENQKVVDHKESIYKVTNDMPVLKECHCNPEDWVFQKREKSKVHSCRVPLHIAFHNYVSCRRMLREAILQYEPINIDIVHKDLVASGYRYDPKDLLKFMDKKCITVKTAENTRNKR